LVESCGKTERAALYRLPFIKAQEKSGSSRSLAGSGGRLITNQTGHLIIAPDAVPDALQDVRQPAYAPG
jgi:hypothetical protein